MITAITVAESVDVLTGMGLTFHHSLDADMSDIGGWEATAGDDTPIWAAVRGDSFEGINIFLRWRP